MRSAPLAKTAILALSLASAAAQEICEKGGKGLFFPLFDSEYTWPQVRQQLISLFFAASTAFKYRFLWLLY